MTDFEARAAASPLDWFNIITDGNLENLMPPWREALTEQERWDVTLYAFGLAYDEAMLRHGERLWDERCAECALPKTIPPVYSDHAFAAQLNRDRFADALSQAEAAAAAAYARMHSLQTEQAATTTVQGQLRNGTAGGEIPPGTRLQLRFGASPHDLALRETVAEIDSSFSFADVPLKPDYSYFISAVVGDRLFTLTTDARDLHTPQTITIYDVTHDPTVIGISRVRLQLNPVRLEDGGDALHVAQIVSYQNASDKLYTSGRGFDDGREASLLLQAPMDTKIVSGENGGRYVLVEALETVPDSVIDTLPVLPGVHHDIAVEYLLPYAAGAEFLQAFSNAVDAEVSLSLPQHLALMDAGFELKETERLDSSFKRYAGQLAESRLRFRVSGDLVPSSGAVIHSEALLIGLAVLGAAGAALTALILRRRIGESEPSIDALTREIAALDGAHDKGQLNHDLWHQKRRALKAELAALTEREGR